MAAPLRLVVPSKSSIIAKKKYGVPAGLSGLARHIFLNTIPSSKGLALPSDFNLIFYRDRFPKEGGMIWSVRIAGTSVTANASAPIAALNWRRFLLQPRLPPAAPSRPPRF